MGGVRTLQAPGKARAWVWLIVTPNEDPPPLRTWHRHCGCDLTTLESCVQHPEEGVEEFPVMKFRHGDRFTNALVQLDCCALAPTHIMLMIITTKTTPISIFPCAAIPIIRTRYRLYVTN